MICCFPFLKLSRTNNHNRRSRNSELLYCVCRIAFLFDNLIIDFLTDFQHHIWNIESIFIQNNNVSLELCPIAFILNWFLNNHVDNLIKISRFIIRIIIIDDIETIVWKSKLLGLNSGFNHKLINNRKGVITIHKEQQGKFLSKSTIDYIAKNIKNMQREIKSLTIFDYLFESNSVDIIRTKELDQCLFWNCLF